MIRSAQQPDFGHMSEIIFIKFMCMSGPNPQIWINFAKIKVINKFVEFMNTPKVSRDD